MRLVLTTALVLAAGVYRPGCGSSPPEPPAPCIMAPNPCAGRACGAECGGGGGGCGDAPAWRGTCDASGECVSPTSPAPECPPPVASCLAQRCGTACQYPCPPEGCPSPPVAAACNGNQDCVQPQEWDLCYVPCAGKRCGDPCHTCPPGSGCVEPALALACDGTGRCVQPPVTCGP